MEAIKALQCAKQLRALGIRFYPRGAATDEEIAARFLGTTERQANQILETAAHWEEWRIDRFTRLLESLRNDDTTHTAATKPSRETMTGLELLFSQPNGGQTALQMIAEADAYAARVPTESEEFRAAELETIERLGRANLGPRSQCHEEPYLEINTRCTLSRHTFEAAVEKLRGRQCKKPHQPKEQE
jgi:hypothetical protein